MTSPVQLTRSDQGLDLYFPPMRLPGSAAALGLFGAACLVAGSLSAAIVVPLAMTGPAGALSAWLMSIFIAPFLLFGLALPVAAVYRVANSLAVRITPAWIMTVRRVFGIAVRRRSCACKEVVAISVFRRRRYALPRPSGSTFDLVARTDTAAITVAESLPDAGAAEQLLAEILHNAGLGHLAQ